jgi:cell division protein ZapE
LPGLSETYGTKVAKGDIAADPQQEAAVAVLERLYLDLTKPVKRGLFGLGPKLAAPRGVYLYGGVGRGKSMLMDLFYAALPAIIPKRRVHFHAFMIDVQEALDRARKNDRADHGIPDYVQAVAAEVRVLCFDEFHVTDVADAMILSRLFTGLLDAGVTVVATSNWQPDRLYEGGLQRDRFLPFIDLIKTRMDVVAMTGGFDYRLKAMTDTGVYFTPLGEVSRARADALFATLTDNEAPHAETLAVRGREVTVETVVKNVARFSFAQLCERPMGAEDYLTIARRYRTVFLDGVPKLNYDRRNEAKRLMILVDTLYDNRIRLIVTADAPPDRLYLGTDHAFEFQRTVSRLIEMQGKDYLKSSIAAKDAV